jgi:hypothetical protein
MQSLLGTSWKTSLAGVATILIALGTLIKAGSDGTITTAQITGFATAITAGIGLIKARDSGVSSEEEGATPAQKQAVANIATAAQTTPTKTP